MNKKQVEKVKSDLSLVGTRMGKFASAIDLCPSLANWISASAAAAASAAVELRTIEAEIANVCSERGISIERLKDNTAASTYGPAVANDAIDLWVRGGQLRQSLKRSVAGLESDAVNGLAQPDVRQELSETAAKLADEEERVAAEKAVIDDAARLLSSTLNLNDALKDDIRRAGVGNLFSSKTGDVVGSGEFVNRHRAIASSIVREEVSA